MYAFWHGRPYILVHFCQPHMPGWSYSYIAIFECVCPSVRLSQSEEAWERVYGGSWFVYHLAAKESQAMLVLSTVEVQLSLHEYNIS